MSETIKFDFPLPRPHCGSALGNGNFGALIWGEQSLNITLGLVSFWDHRGGNSLSDKTPGYSRLVKLLLTKGVEQVHEKYFPFPPEYVRTGGSQRLPVGRFELSFPDSLRPVHARLDCLNGILAVELNNGVGRMVHLDINLSPFQNILLIRKPHNVSARIKARPAWEWVGAELSKRGFKPPRIIRKDKLTGYIQDCPADPSCAVLLKEGKDSLTVAVALGTDAAEASSQADVLFKKIEQQGQSAFCEETRQWWRRYWRKVPRINVPSLFFRRFFVYAQYKFACATNPNAILPAPLQGPWTEEYQLQPWRGSYVFDVNVQQIYTFGFINNCLDHLLPLFAMLESDSFQKEMRRDAKILFGIDDGLYLQQWVDDRGHQSARPGVFSSLDPALGGWTAQLYWFYYLYSRDVNFLRERAYPFMLGVFRSFEEMLEKKGGKLSLSLSFSPEYFKPQSRKLPLGRNATYQLTCLHMLTDALSMASALLDVPARPIWKEIKKKLPKYSLVGDENDRRMALWEGQDLEGSHRHHSHLAGIYPFDVFELSDPETRKIVDNTIDHWISKGFGLWSEWCVPWAAIIQARLGFKKAPLMLMDIWREVFINEGLATAYIPRFRGITAHRRELILQPKEANEIMQLDGTMGAATAICEFLIHNKRGITYIFPAVPDKWQTVSFKNIRVPGPFLVSAKKNDGVVQEVKIKSLAGGTIKIVVVGAARMLLNGQSGKTKTIRFPASISLKRGETVDLKNQLN